MNQNKILFFSVFIIIFLGGCFDSSSKDSKHLTQKRASRVAHVDVVSAKISDNNMSFSYPCVIESSEDVTLVPKVSGAVELVNFKAGQSVKKGDVLFALETERFATKVLSAKANLLSAKANYKNTSKQFKRSKKLFEANAIPLKQYESSLLSNDVAYAKLQNAIAELKFAKLDFNYSKIKAPFDGVVSENLVNLGNYVFIGQTPLVKITNLNKLKARFFISDTLKFKFANLLSSNDLTVKFITKGISFDGKLDFVDNVIDSSSSSFLAKASIKNLNHSLYVGSFGKVIINGVILKNSFKIPKIAVHQDSKSPYLLVVKDKVITKVPVEISYEKNDYVLVTKGLNNLDEVVINNFNKIRVGSKVIAKVKE